MSKKKTLKSILETYKLNGTLYPDNPSYGTDKGDAKNYIDGFYEESFSRYKNRDITIVEIGVRSGASLCLWKNYFSKKSSIIGLDNLVDKNQHSVPVNEEWISGDNVQYLIGDAYDQSMSDQIPSNIDILIDDGPHNFESHVKMLELYTDKMNDGGVIVIEDIHYNPNMLFPYVKEKYQDNAKVYDFGGWDNRLIVINT